MAVTGQQVIDRLDNIFNDTSNGKWSAARKLEFVNAAIDSAWSLGIKEIRLDTSITVVDTTFEYTPTNQAELEDGYAEAYVTPVVSDTIEPENRLRRVWQRLAQTSWQIVMPADLTRLYDGETLQLRYNRRIARITVASSSIELPLDYLWQYAAYMAALAAHSSGAQFDAKPWGEQIAVWRANAERAAIGNRRGLITKLPIAYDIGKPSAYDPNAGIYQI